MTIRFSKMQENYFKKLMFIMFELPENEISTMFIDNTKRGKYFLPCSHKLRDRLSKKFADKPYSKDIAKILKEHYTKVEKQWGIYSDSASVAFICEWLYHYPQYRNLEEYRAAIAIFDVKPVFRE